MNSYLKYNFSVKKSLKILMVSDVYYPFPGGITEHVHHLAYYLQNRGHDVTILTGNHRNGHQNFGLNSVKVIRIGRGILFPINKSFYSLPVSFNLPLQIKEILLGNDWDIVHVHGTLSPSLPLFTLLQSPYVNFMTFHPTHGYSIGFELFKPILNRAFENIDGKIAVSKSALRSIKRHFNGKFRIIPNGVDTRRFGPHVAPMKNLKIANEKIVLFVGRIEPRKGLSTLIKAFELVVKKIPEAKLVIVGDTPLKRVYEYRTRKLTDRVVFLGKVPAKMIPSVYRSADVFVAPASGKESFGIVLIEAMASKIPVIASDIEGYREVVIDGHNGLLFPVNDYQHLAETIERVLKDRDLASKLEENGRNYVEGKFSWDVITDQIENFYSEVLQNAKKVLR